MAHFAEIDETNTVLRVLVVPDEQEHRGHDYLADDLGLGGRWIQTSYNNNVRKQYAGIGYTYDESGDVFIAPRPGASWSLDENYDWQPPIPMPEMTPEHLSIYWDEATESWIEVMRDE